MLSRLSKCSALHSLARAHTHCALSAFRLRPRIFPRFSKRSQRTGGARSATGLAFDSTGKACPAADLAAASLTLEMHPAKRRRRDVDAFFCPCCDQQCLHVDTLRRHLHKCCPDICDNLASVSPVFSLSSRAAVHIPLLAPPYRPY